jgi:transposase InsO family protein
MAYSYRSRAWAVTPAELGTRRKRPRPYRPQTNGKAEPFIQDDASREWAYARPYRSNAESLAALAEWVASYNHERTHTALDGRTPMDRRVSNIRVNHS